MNKRVKKYKSKRVQESRIFLTLLLFYFCTLVLPIPAWAAITAEGTVSSNGVTATTVSFTHDSGASGTNCIIIVGVVERDESGLDDITSATFNGDPLTKKSFLWASGNINASILYRLAPFRGSGTVTVNRSGTDAIVAGAQTYCGVDQSTPFGTAVTTSGSAASSSVNATSATGELVLDVIGQSGGASSMTVGGGQTQLFQTAGGSRIGAMSSKAGAGTVAMSWTTDGGEVQVQIAIAIKAGGAAPALAKRRVVIVQ